MLLKLGVSIERLERNTRRSLNIVGDVYQKYYCEPVITCTDSGLHSLGSLHYAHRAYDLRLPSKQVAPIVQDLKTDLGIRFDVILEKDHIHIEYDPKA